MTLDNICTMRGSGHLLAVYDHCGANQFRIKLIFKNNSKRFVSDKTWRTKTQLMHEWQNNRYKFYGYNYSEAN